MGNDVNMLIMPTLNFMEHSSKILVTRREWNNTSSSHINSFDVPVITYSKLKITIDEKSRTGNT